MRRSPRPSPKFQSDETHQAVVAELGRAHGEVYGAWEASGGAPAIEATTAEELPPF